MVTTDPEEAVAASDRGETAVLVVRAGAQVVAARPGRLAILVGEPHDPATLAAAEAMELELFRAGTGESHPPAPA